MAFKMTPALKAYMKRTLDLVGDKDPHALLKGAPGKFERATRGMNAAALSRRPARGKWSIVEQVGHLADVEVVFAGRIRRAMAEPGSAAQPFDQDVWVEKLQHRKANFKTLLGAWRALREANLALVAAAPRRTRAEGFAQHPERGRQPVDFQLLFLAGHDLNHLGQVGRIRKQFAAKKTAARRAPARGAKKGAGRSAKKGARR